MVKYIYINIFFDILIKRVIKMKDEKLSSKVYSKNFNTKAVGFDVREVDNFLDELNIICSVHCNIFLTLKCF